MRRNKTRMTTRDVDAFLGAVVPAGKAADARARDALFGRVTGFLPVMRGLRLSAMADTTAAIKAGVRAISSPPALRRANQPFRSISCRGMPISRHPGPAGQTQDRQVLP